jgi:hypothetical protein
MIEIAHFMEHIRVAIQHGGGRVDQQYGYLSSFLHVQPFRNGKSSSHPQYLKGRREVIFQKP